MERETYRSIGYAYEYAERIAPYSFGGKNTAKLRLYPSTDRKNYEANEGVSTILMIEAGLPFDVKDGSLRFTVPSFACHTVVSTN